MRISDWSSDVCSSDLAARRQELPLRAAHPGAVAADRPAPRCAQYPRALLRPVPERRGGARDAQPGAPAVQAAQLCSRKSVGSGKSVSVRVDPGARRIIKKNTTQTHKTQQTSET